MYCRGKDLIRALRSRHREMESKRRKDARKVEDLQHSIGNGAAPPAHRAIDFGDINEPPLFPSNQIESVLDIYTTVSWKQVYDQIDCVVGNSGGVCTWNAEDIKV